jgi:hypothetical protein
VASKSKTKGKSFEREVANFLSDLYEESFIRVPGSGAFVGGANAVRKDTLSEGQIRGAKSDIIPPDLWNHLNIECKNYADFPFHQLLWNKSIPLLDSWIEQLLEPADPKDLNLLIMKFNRKGRYIAFETKIADRISPARLYTSRHVTYRHTNSNTEWFITEFDDFWSLNKAQVKTLCIQGTDPFGSVGTSTTQS